MRPWWIAIGIVGCTPSPATAPSEVAVAAVSSDASAPAPSKIDFEIIAVDDSDDVIQHLAEDALPPGFEVHWEYAPDGPGRSRKTYFVQALAAAQESPSALFARAARWSSAVALQGKKRIAWQDFENEDAETQRTTFVGVRSYVVKGDPIITTADVKRAAAHEPHPGGSDEAYVSIELDAAGTKRFADATEALLNRRFAILVGGQVWSAPVVKARIDEGRLSITMGLDRPDSQIARAKALAKALGGHQ